MQKGGKASMRIGKRSAAQGKAAAARWEDTAMKLHRLALAGTALAAFCAFAPGAATAQDQAPITVVINQSPWLNGFVHVVDMYEEETGNEVNLDVNPFAGSLEKQRSAVRSPQSDFDLLIINGLFYAEMYHGGFLEPLHNIDPDFELDPELFRLDDTTHFDPERMVVSRETGELMTVPINPNISMLFYRADLYEEAGLEVPRTWEELKANAVALHNPPSMVGIVQRGARAATAVSWDYWPYLLSHGGSLFRDEGGGDFFVTLNSPEALAALQTYIDIAKAAGPGNTASLDQTDLIQYMVTGRAAHAILTIAAQSQMDDPNNSIVVGKIGYANLPTTEGHDPAPALGHWLGGIPKNIPEERKSAALAFLDWFQQTRVQIEYARGGGTPVSNAAFNSEELAQEDRFRYMAAMAEAAPYARGLWTIPEGGEIVSILEVGLNQAVAGEIEPAAALNRMAAEIEALMTRAGYETGRLPDL